MSRRWLLFSRCDRVVVAARCCKSGVPLIPRCVGVRGFLLAAGFILVNTSTAAAPTTSDLIDLSLEQLSDMEITSVSRHAERLSDAPASIFVITTEDIRRSGATSLPDVLRIAQALNDRTGSRTAGIPRAPDGGRPLY